MCVNCWKNDVINDLEHIRDAYKDDDQNWVINPVYWDKQIDDIQKILDELKSLNSDLRITRTHEAH